MAAVATSERDPADSIATWSYTEVTEALNAAVIEVSVSLARRILTAMDSDLSKAHGCGAVAASETTEADLSEFPSTFAGRRSSSDPEPVEGSRNRAADRDPR